MSKHMTDKSDFQTPACLLFTSLFPIHTKVPPELRVKMAALEHAMVSPSYPKFLLQNSLLQLR